MKLKTLFVALALLAGTASSALAQSQPNYGPGRNNGGDTYGKPYSGSAQARHNSANH